MKRRAKQTSARRLTVILSALVIALALVGSMAAMAIAADTVETRDSWQSGNASFECAQAGCTFSEFAYKVEPWDAGDPSGTYSAPGGASISITARGSGGEYKSFDWSISDGFVVHCVIVKAGTGALIYRYGEDGATSDGGLQGYQGKAVSHATFCYSKVTPQTGSLEITKTIVDAPDDTWGPEDFSITVTGPDPATAQVYSG
ncbi:MAG: hypothetical protein GX601_11695, partial [Anaerolineales bacterium]|nr:hypothetical protein [Anaerolineales bacterium]